MTLKKFTPLSKLPQEAVTASKNYLRYMADQIKAKGCPIHLNEGCEHRIVLHELADCIIHLDDHMKAGGEMPTGWSFFSEYGRDGK